MCFDFLFARKITSFDLLGMQKKPAQCHMKPMKPIKVQYEKQGQCCHIFQGTQKKWDTRDAGDTRDTRDTRDNKGTKMTQEAQGTQEHTGDTAGTRGHKGHKGTQGTQGTQGRQGTWGHKG